MALFFTTFSQKKEVEVRKALASGELSEIIEQDGRKMLVEIVDVVAFIKDPSKRRSELSDHDCSLSLTQRVRDAETGESIGDLIKVSGAISAKLWEALANGQDLIKVPFKEEYNRKDIKGSPANLKKLQDLGAILYQFDAWQKNIGEDGADHGEYPETEDGQPITENLIVGLPDEFEIDPSQERHCNQTASTTNASGKKKVETM